MNIENTARDLKLTDKIIADLEEQLSKQRGMLIAYHKYVTGRITLAELEKVLKILEGE